MPVGTMDAEHILLGISSDDTEGRVGLMPERDEPWRGYSVVVQRREREPT